MDKLIKGTTPTIKYTFASIPVSDITEAILTIVDGAVTLQKDITTAIVTQKTIGWTLSQAETLAFKSATIVIRLNWLANDGTRGASERATVLIESNELNEVIE